MKKILVYIHIVYRFGIVIDALEALNAARAQFSELFAGMKPTRGSIEQKVMGQMSMGRFFALKIKHFLYTLISA